MPCRPTRKGPNVTYKPNEAARIAVLLTSGLLMLSCANNSPVLPVVPEPIKIASPPASVDPKPSGWYLQMYCQTLERAQKTLNTKLQTPEHCSTLGLK